MDNDQVQVYLSVYRHHFPKLKWAYHTSSMQVTYFVGKLGGLSAIICWDSGYWYIVCCGPGVYHQKKIPEDDSAYPPIDHIVAALSMLVLQLIQVCNTIDLVASDA